LGSPRASQDDAGWLTAGKARGNTHIARTLDRTQSSVIYHTVCPLFGITYKRIDTMRVFVLMSTYNGQSFVVEQIQSILQQLPPDGRLFIRDDGSYDGTVGLINAIVDDRIQVEFGPNLGFGKSFLTLLATVPENAEMVMFSDQDDVWLPNKINRAWTHLQTVTSGPALYCSAQLLVDEHLQHLEVSTPPMRKPPSFEGALVENIVTGCTAALNSAGTRLMQRGGVPDKVHFHDWWLYLVLSAFGTVLVDSAPTLLYRQHGKNLIGRGTGWWNRHIQIVRFLIKNDWVAIMLGQISSLDSIYRDRLNEKQRKLLYCHFLKNNSEESIGWRAILGHQGWRQTVGNEIFFRMLLISKKIGFFPLRK